MTASNHFPKQFASMQLTAINGYIQLPQRPYLKSYSNTLYETLFCDNLSYFLNEETISHYPWDLVLDKNCTKETLKDLLLDDKCPARARILASNLLQKRNEFCLKNDFLGAILEIRQRDGLDVIAVYSDGSARFINHKEQIFIWEKNTPEYGRLFDNLVQNVQLNLNELRFSNVARQPVPIIGKARLSILGTGGKQVSEYDLLALRKEAQNNHVIESCLRIMVYLGCQKNKQFRPAA